MKILFVFCMFATVASASLSAPEVARYLQGVKTELTGLRAELAAAGDANERLQVDLFSAQDALLTSAAKNASSLAAQAAALGQVARLQTDLAGKDAAYGKLIADNAQLQEDKKSEHAKYLRAKFFIGGIAGLVAGFLTLLLLLRFAVLALDSLGGIAVVCGVPIIVSGAVFAAMQLLF